MKKCTKMIAVLLSALLGLGLFAGCTTEQQNQDPEDKNQQGLDNQGDGQNQDNKDQNDDKTPDGDKELIKIGIVQLAEHDALDAAYRGFVDGLAEAGYVDGKNIKIDYQNAQNEQQNCQIISQKFVNDKCDLILAIATQAAQSAANETSEIPILVTAVTDPATSGLVQSNEAPGTNVSGTSDLTPVAEQMNLIKQLLPDAHNIGMLYCSNEPNSEFQIKLAEQKATELGLEYQEFTVSSSSEIQQVVESMVGKVDVIYSPTDNMIAAGMATVSMVATEAGIPIICGEEGMVAKGGFATYGINYYNLGKQTGAMAVRIIKDGAKPQDMPIEYLQEAALVINQDIVDALKIEIPEDLKQQATFIHTLTDTEPQE